MAAKHISIFRATVKASVTISHIDQASGQLRRRTSEERLQRRNAWLVLTFLSESPGDRRLLFRSVPDSPKPFLEEEDGSTISLICMSAQVVGTALMMALQSIYHLLLTSRITLPTPVPLLSHTTLAFPSCSAKTLTNSSIPPPTPK